MNAKNYYVIDTSSLIELKKFPIDVFPSLWKNIEALIDMGFMISHKEVLKELSYQDDALKKWAQKQKKFFKELDAYQIKIVKEILKKYPSLAKSDSESPSADPFVIALAIEFNRNPQKTLTLSIQQRVVVSEERLRGFRVRIPFVCKEYGIECITMIEMCRSEGWKF
jgi:hypothetical protein